MTGRAYPHPDTSLNPEQVARLAEGFCPWDPMRAPTPGPHSEGSQRRPCRMPRANVTTQAGDTQVWGHCFIMDMLVKASDGHAYTVSLERAEFEGWTITYG